MGTPNYHKNQVIENCSFVAFPCPIPQKEVRFGQTGYPSKGNFHGPALESSEQNLKQHSENPLCWIVWGSQP
jgi:exo-beta-1,3-glucanase (GH17 family)